MPDRIRTKQILRVAMFPEYIAYQSSVTLGHELAAIKGDDPRRFLTSMLQRMQPQRSQCPGILVAENSEDATFLMQLVVVRCSHGMCRDLPLVQVSTPGVSATP
jgi:hypothetical protein